MALALRIFSSDSSPRPGLACEIAPDGVIAARQKGADEATISFAPLSAGLVQPGLAAANFANPAAITSAVRSALDVVALRQKHLTLVVPDGAVRVLILDFDSLPSKVSEALPIVRFRLRKLAPFEVDDAALSYQIMRQEPEQVRVLVTVMPADVRREYEAVVREAGYEPGVILPSMLASLAALRSGDAALVVNRNGLSLTTAITNGDELLLHRTMELPTNDAAQREEVTQAVSVASAYFEDTMHTAPSVLYYAGPGGAEAFVATLGAETEDGLRMVRDLVSTSSAGAATAIPKGLTAGVTGALASK